MIINNREDILYYHFTMEVTPMHWWKFFHKFILTSTNSLQVNILFLLSKSFYYHKNIILIIIIAGRLKYWTDKENQRQFFRDIAKDQNFDPLIARNWYSMTVRKILNYKVYFIYMICIITINYNYYFIWLMIIC